MRDGWWRPCLRARSETLCALAPPQPTGTDPGESADEAIDYGEFGRRFFDHAVTEERIVGAMRGLAGDRIEFGPIGAGPGKIAKVSAVGELGLASAARIPGDLVVFRLTIPVALDLSVGLGPDTHEFHAAIEVGLTLTARAVDRLVVVIDIEPPTWRDVDLELEADGMRAGVLRRVADIDREIRRFVAKFVAREVDKPHIRDARRIDVAARIDKAWRP